MTNQPHLVAAILRELDRQQPGILCGERLFAVMCRAADEIIAAVNSKPAPVENCAERMADASERTEPGSD